MMDLCVLNALKFFSDISWIKTMMKQYFIFIIKIFTYYIIMTFYLFQLLYFTMSWIHIVLDFGHFLYKKKKSFFPAPCPGFLEILTIK